MCDKKALAPGEGGGEGMSQETVIILQGIKDEVHSEIIRKHDELFKKTGCKTAVIKHMEKLGVKSSERNKVSVQTLDQAKMIQETGTAFKILPTAVDGITRLPISGDAYRMEIKKAEPFDFAEEILNLEEKLLSEAVEKNPDDKHLDAALRAIKGNKEHFLGDKK